jgi:hypothetical protein
VNQHIPAPIDEEDPEPCDEPAADGDEWSEGNDYQLDGDERTPEEAGYGYGV